MRHWLQVATRNWRVKRIRTAGAVLAIALGTAAVVWVTCCYESVRQTVTQWAEGYIGASHITIQSPLGKYDVLPQRLVDKIAAVAGVRDVAPLLVQRLAAATVGRTEWEAAGRDPAGRQPSMLDLDVHGIDLAHELAVRDWYRVLRAGRMLRPDDTYACVLEASVAEEEGVGVGDMLLLWGRNDPREPPAALEIVGIIERRRIARFLKGVALVRLPVLQELCVKPALVNEIAVVLDDPSPARLQSVGRALQAVTRGENVLMRSAAARQAQIALAQSQQEAVLILLSCVAMLTALFIILSTLSMGMVERIAQLGLLRCIGTTGWQLVGLTMAEVLPLGVLGVLAGIPIGLGLTALTVWLVPEYVGTFTVSPRGIGLATAAGLLTTLVGAALPALAAATVSPLEATRPRARQAGTAVLLVAFGLGLAALAVQAYIMGHRLQRDLQFVRWSVSAVVLLYLFYALAAPLLVRVAGRVAVPVTAALTAVRLRLLQDQIGHAVWRSAGIVCGLMVGLSLIVGLIVFNESFRSGWQFPKQFPEAYVWSFDQIEGDVPALVAGVPGVRQATAANAVNVLVEERPLLMEQVLRSVTWFLGIEPDSFLDLVKLEFLEGDEETARALLKQGGHVLVAADFARTRRKGVREVRDAEGNVVIGNTVRVLFNNRWTTFRIAGVIDSPALDIAAAYFQVESESMVVAVGSVVGTNADLRRLFNVDGYKLVLLNFDLPPEPPPPGWPPPPDSPEGRWLSHKTFDQRLPLQRRWDNYREVRVLQDVLRCLRAPKAFYGTARELKDEIDAELTRITYLLTAVPAVALVVAAIGVANLMTANVASRARQLAILRAVGATRGLVLRMVIGETLVLGLLGGLLGLALGMHLAWNVTTMTERMWGYAIRVQVPWPFVAAAVALSIALCIAAAVAPARHAARTNVIDALHVA